MAKDTLFSLLLLPLHFLLWWGGMHLLPEMDYAWATVIFQLVLSFPALASCILYLWFKRSHTAVGCLWFCMGLPMLTCLAVSLIIINILYPAESMAGYVVLMCLFNNLLCCLLLPLLRLLTRHRKTEIQQP